jgi:hypothetical protein
MKIFFKVEPVTQKARQVGAASRDGVLETAGNDRDEGHMLPFPAERRSRVVFYLSLTALVLFLPIGLPLPYSAADSDMTF